MATKQTVTARASTTRALKTSSPNILTEDPAKAKRREKMAEMSARVSETSRLILFGVLALGYGLFSGEGSFSRSLVSQNEFLLKCLVGLAALGVAIDFAQYAAGYRSADVAFRNSSSGYKYKEDTVYWIWNNCYYGKIIVTAILFAIIGIISANSLFSPGNDKKTISQITYVAFDSGQDRLSPLFGPQITRMAENAKSGKLQLVEITGSVDPEESKQQVANLAQRRAQGIASQLIDGGVPANKVQIVPHSTSKTGDLLRDVAQRVVRVKIVSED